jgi:hypothetical protein
MRRSWDGLKMTDKRYSGSIAAIAAGINGSTLRSWMQREIILLEKEERGAINGTGHQLTRETIERIATMATLVQAGFPPATAEQHAFRFVRGLEPILPPDVTITLDIAAIKRRVALVLDTYDLNVFNPDGSEAMGEIVEG